MAEPTSTEQTESRRAGGTSLLWLFAALAIYVLSIGPAAKLYYAVPQTQHLIEITYKPIVALCGSHPPLSRALSWYVMDVWKVRMRYYIHVRQA